jgi:hypothetical protein
MPSESHMTVYTPLGMCESAHSHWWNLKNDVQIMIYKEYERDFGRSTKLKKKVKIKITPNIIP